MGAEECCIGFLKLLAAFSNFIFFAAGITLSVFGGLFLSKFSEFSDLTSDSYDAIPIAIVVLGCFVSLVSLIGLLSVYSDDTCANFFKKFYSIILIILVVLELSCGIAAYVKRDNVTKILDDTALSSIHEDWGIKVVIDDGKYSFDRNSTAVAWQILQEEFNCCGYNNYTDWNNSTETFGEYVKEMEGWLDVEEFTLTKNPVPDSCCIVSEFGFGLTYQNINEDIYTEGCKDSVESFLTDNIAIIAGAAVGLAVLQISLIFLFWHLANHNLA